MAAKIQIHSKGYWINSSNVLHGNSPELAEWLEDYLRGNEGVLIYDLGCGDGGYIKHLKQHGFTRLIGVEGEPGNPVDGVDIRKLDLSTDLSDSLTERGIVITLEVGEHIPAQYMTQFVDTVDRLCSTKLILSWAIRGQGGHGHVNCLDNHEVVSIFADRGFKHDPDASTSARNSIGKACPWFKNTILVFNRSDDGDK